MRHVAVLTVPSCQAPCRPQATGRLLKLKRLVSWLLLLMCSSLLSACGACLWNNCSNDSSGSGAVSLSSQPSAVSIKDGAPAVFSVVAQGNGPFTYQWSRNGTPIAGATSASYTIAVTQLSDDGSQFSVTVRSAEGSVQSSVATLSVGAAAPAVQAQTAGEETVTAVQGDSATLTVKVSGTLPMRFQWRRNGVPIDGATAASYVTPATSATDNGAVYDVVITNVAGSVTSGVFTLNVTGSMMAPTIVGQPQPVSVRAGGPATFSVGVGGASNLSYQWLRDDLPISGAQAATYTLGSTMLADNLARFSVTVSNSAGSVTSGAARLTVLRQPGLSILAGAVGGPGARDGTSAAASFNEPNGIATDSAGNLYIADTSNRTIRKMTPSGVVTTLAGAAGQRGSVDGTGASARFHTPYGIAVDGAGNVFVTESNTNVIRRITPAGAVTTVAGSVGQSGYADGIGAAALFHSPVGIAVDATGNLYVADMDNSVVRKIAPDGTVTTFAGVAGNCGSFDGPALSATFCSPSDVAIDSSGKLYVANSGSGTIRVISPAGDVTTLAGDASTSGSVFDGNGTAARFQHVERLALDGAGNVYAPDRQAQVIRKITPSGDVTTLAGTLGVRGFADGSGSTAKFDGPVGAAADGAGGLFVTEINSGGVRRISAGGVVSTAAGTPAIKGSADGTGTAARFGAANALAADRGGNVYFGDVENNVVRRITAAGVVTTLAGSPGLPGSNDGVGASARFQVITGLALDQGGNLYAVDGNTVRKISAAGVVTTLAGNAGMSGSADGSGSAATFNNPFGVAVDAANNVYVGDTDNCTIRKISPSGEVTTLAGAAQQCQYVDGPAANARFGNISGIAFDGAGNLLIADFAIGVIRKLSPAGVVSTLAGDPANGQGSVDGTGAAALFSNIYGLTVDEDGNAYAADTLNGVIRRITPAGVVTTVVGVADGVLGTTLGALPGHLSYPYGVAAGPGGVLYVPQYFGVVRIDQ